MKFCNKCDNMYYIGINQTNNNNIQHYCRYCENIDENISSEGSCIIDVNTKITQQNDVVNEYTKQDPTLPHLYNITCSNAECKSNKKAEIKSDIIFLRYNDKDMKYVYICTHCDHSWKTNDI